MNWVALVASGVMECVWAIALDKSDGFSNALPTAVFLAALVLSMLGLGYAAKSLPIGVAYAVWTGIGVVATTLVSAATGAEPLSLLKACFLVGLVGCIAGLRIVTA